MTLKTASLASTLAAAALLGAVGCGDDGGEKGLKLVELGDCSSVPGNKLGEAIATAVVGEIGDRLVDRPQVVVGCFDGEPRRSLHWQRIDFSSGAVPANDGPGCRYNLPRFERAAPRIKATLSRKSRFPGSHLLDALAMSSDERPDELHVWTDGVQIGAGIDLRHPIDDAALRRAIRHWKPSMRGLAKTKVVFIGAGQGSGPRELLAARQARALFGGLLEEVGATVDWRPFEHDIEDDLPLKQQRQRFCGNA